MSKTAQRIVATLLEDFAGFEGDPEERAGHSRDMWRQGGFKKFSLKGKDFTGKRPGEAGKPETEDEEEAEPSAPKMHAHASRFQWKPKV
jgi:hypothetical protein